jgi:hypothetical protein
MDLINAEVLATLQDDVLRPSVVERAVALALEELNPHAEADRDERRQAEIKAIDAEHAELMAAVTRGGSVDVLARRVGRLQGLQARRDALLVSRPSRAANAGQGLAAGLEQRIREKVADWRGLLTRNVESGRDALKALLVDPLMFYPEVSGARKAYRFRGAIALDRLVEGVIDPQIGAKTLTDGSFPAGFARCGNAARAWFSDLRAA